MRLPLLLAAALLVAVVAAPTAVAGDCGLDDPEACTRLCDDGTVDCLPEDGPDPPTSGCRPTC